jgi:hypothetical protein
MLNKMAGTGSTMFGAGRAGQRTESAAPSGERSVATALNTSGKLIGDTSAMLKKMAGHNGGTIWGAMGSGQRAE